MRLALAVLMLVSTAGCVGFTYDRKRVGTPRAILDARLLETGRATLKEALEKLGPPELILRAGPIDRAYWVALDGSYFKFRVSFPIRNFSYDAFILGLGSENLSLARLEFDREGILRYAHIADFERSQEGQYVAIDNLLVSNFLEDRNRFLRLLDEDDDEEDVEIDKPPR